MKWIYIAWFWTLISFSYILIINKQVMLDMLIAFVLIYLAICQQIKGKKNEKITKICKSRRV